MSHSRGFTLIELSIVLVIIGLVIGGILVGQDMVAASAVRAQIAQIEKYRTAMNTFRAKYNCLPGDCADGTALGFVARGSYAGQGDGNGLFEGVWDPGPNYHSGLVISTGETAVFWRDLSDAGLIDGSFKTATMDTWPSAAVTGDDLKKYMPVSVLGDRNYVYLWQQYNMHFLTVSAITQLTTNGNMYSNHTMRVSDAYNIDKKIDDGMPTSGNVAAFYPEAIPGGRWADPDDGNDILHSLVGGDVPANDTSCFDGKGMWTGGTGITNYSMEINGGNGTNCALSFRLQ